jgi:hypothetical protein
LPRADKPTVSRQISKRCATDRFSSAVAESPQALLVAAIISERVEQGVGHRFIKTDMTNERQMRAMQMPDLRF